MLDADFAPAWAAQQEMGDRSLERLASSAMIAAVQAGIDERQLASGPRRGSSSAAKPVPDELEAQVAQADEQLFSKLRAMLGLDQVLTVNVGAAPTPAEVLEFFHAIGIEVAELWGMSELVRRRHHQRGRAGEIGTVVRPMPGVVVELADDGGAASGPGGDGRIPGPEQTAEALDVDRRLHTGDIAGLIPRLPADRRSEEGLDHQRGRQEHVAAEHRGGAQGRVAR